MGVHNYRPSRCNSVTSAYKREREREICRLLFTTNLIRDFVETWLCHKKRPLITCKVSAKASGCSEKSGPGAFLSPLFDYDLLRTERIFSFVHQRIRRKMPVVYL